MAGRELSLFDCVMLGVGSALGPEIFILLGLAAATAGTASVLSIGLAFFIALLVGLCYAELSAAIPRSGEDYVFARQAFHGMVPFLVGWIVWFGNISYTAFNAIAIAYFLRAFMPAPIGITAVVFLCLGAALLYFGLNVLKQVQNIMVCLLLLALAAFVYSGSSAGDWSFLPSIFSGNFGTAFSTAAFLFVAFIGFEDIVSVSSQIRNPGKTLPRAIIITLIILAIIYLSISLTVFAVLPLPAIVSSSNVVIDAARIVMGNNGASLLAIAGMLAIATSINAALTAGTTNACALGKDGYLPKRLARICSKGSTPYAIAATAGLAIVFATTEAVAIIAYLTDFAYFVAMAISAYALIELRKKQPSIPRPFKTPFYPLIPALAITLAIVSLFLLHPQSLLVGVLWMLTGAFAYYLYVIGMKRVIVALGGVFLFISALGFVAYFLVEAGDFALPKVDSLSLNGAVLLASIIFLAIGASLVLSTPVKRMVSLQEA